MFDAPVHTTPRIEAETADDASAVEALVLAAFGPGRFAKTAERLREHAPIAAAFVARDGERVVGSVRLWSIRIGDTPALFLGPIAVEDARRGSGVGADLVAACLAHANAAALGVLLVGDMPYFCRFGFEVSIDVRMPGPVDRQRVLGRGLVDVAGSATANEVVS